MTVLLFRFRFILHIKIPRNHKLRFFRNKVLKEKLSFREKKWSMIAGVLRLFFYVRYTTEVLLIMQRMVKQLNNTLKNASFKYIK